MQVHTRHTPDFGVARIVLSAGEAVQAHSDAFVASSYGITESRQSKGAGGLSVYSAGSGDGWLDLAPEHAGDVYPLEFDGKAGWSVVPQRVLARPATVRKDQTWPALQALFGGESGFVEHFSGTGQLVLACHGPVDALTLDAGEVVTVRPAFLLAYPDGIQARLRAVDPSGPQSVRTGAGLMLDFAGPGTVLIQGRKGA